MYLYLIQTQKQLFLLWGHSIGIMVFLVQTVFSIPSRLTYPLHKIVCICTFLKIFILYCLYTFHMRPQKMSPGGQIFLVLLYLWGHLVHTSTHTHTHTHTHYSMCMCMCMCMYMYMCIYIYEFNWPCPIKVHWKRLSTSLNFRTRLCHVIICFWLVSIS